MCQIGTLIYQSDYIHNGMDIINNNCLLYNCGSELHWTCSLFCTRILNAQTSSDKGKGKSHPITGHEGPEGEYSYSPTLSLTSALDVVGGQRHDPAALPPGKTRYPLYRRLGEPQGRSGRVRKISPTPGFDPRTVQPVVSRFTD
jgi:hypothetical protein